MNLQEPIRDFTFDLEAHLPENFSGSSRVWIYQADRIFTVAEAFELEKVFENFVSSWNSHGVPVKGFANLFFGRFIVLMADELQTTVSGCSTDSSVAMIRDIEARYKTNLFNRQALVFMIKGKMEVIPMQQLSYAIEHGFITPETLYFNNTVLTKKELLEKWIAPAGRTWLSRYFKSQIL